MGKEGRARRAGQGGRQEGRARTAGQGGKGKGGKGRAKEGKQKRERLQTTITTVRDHDECKLIVWPLRDGGVGPPSSSQDLLQVTIITSSCTCGTVILTVH